MSKKKLIYFGILSVLLVYFSIQSIRYCDIPIFKNAPQYFIKPQNADMLLYNLSVGYIVSYMFYLLVNFIPDFVDSIEKQSQILPFRAAIQREVQQFVSDILSLWTSIGITSSDKGTFDITKVNTIDKFFNPNIIRLSAKGVNLQEQADYDDIFKYLFNWIEKILAELNKICSNGNLILTRYKEDIPSEIFYDIFYLLNESSLIGNLFNMVQAINSLPHKINSPLSDCMSWTDDKGSKDIAKTCESIINLYNWVNKEYDYLVANINNDNIMINKIDIHNFFKTKNLRISKEDVLKAMKS